MCSPAGYSARLPVATPEAPQAATAPASDGASATGRAPMMKPTLRQLQVFQAVARTLSFSQAAQELYLAQPTVSMEIKQLEKLVGQPLFERIGRRVYLSAAGQELLSYSQRILGLLDEAMQAMDELKGLRRGALSLAADTTAGVYVMPALLGRFQSRYPEVTISMSVVNRSAVQEQLRQNLVDLAILGQLPDDQELAVAPFLQNRLVPIALPSHPLASRESIPFAEFAREPLLIRERGSGTRGATEAAFARQGIVPRIAMELSSNSAIKQGVLAGMGLTVISEQAIALEAKVGMLVTLPVAGFPLVRDWHVVHLRDKRLSPVAAAFMRFLLARRDASGPGQPASGDADGLLGGGA